MLALRAGPDNAGQRRWAVLAVVSAAQFLIIADLWIVAVALPALQRDFAPAALPDVAWILDAYAIALAALLVPAGRIADRTGRRAAFLAGLAVFGVASLGCAVAPGLAALIACRAGQAAGAAVVMPTSLGFALAVFPPQQRRTAVGIWSGVGAVAAGSGPVVGGLLVESSWRWIFLINLPIIVAALVAGAAVLPRRDGATGGPRPGRRVDRTGMVLVMGAVGLVCTALTESSRWPVPRTELVLTVGLFLAAVLVVRIRWRPDALVSPQLFAPRAFRAGAAGLVAYYTGFAALLLSMTLLLTAQWHFSVLQAAVGIVPGPATAGFVSLAAGRLAARAGSAATVAAGAAAFAAAGAWLLAGASGHPAYVAVALPAGLLWGVANGLIQPSLFACADAAPRAELAAGSAVLGAARQLGSALGVAIFVAVTGSGVTEGGAAGLAGLNRAWAIVVITAGATAIAGLGTGWQPAGATVAMAGTAGAAGGTGTAGGPAAPAGGPAQARR
jgi:MFS family permease